MDSRNLFTVGYTCAAMGKRKSSLRMVMQCRLLNVFGTQSFVIKKRIGNLKNSFYRSEEGRRTLRLHNNRFTTLQVLTHRLDVLFRDHVDKFAEFLPNFDLLTSVDGELEVLWSFKY